MTVHELNISHEALGEKIQPPQERHELPIRATVKNRSKRILAAMQANLARTILFLSILLGLTATVLVGNPFEYTRWFEYVPAVLYALLLVSAGGTVVQQYRRIRPQNLTQSNLRESLQSFIESQERYRSVMSTGWRLNALAGFVLSFSLTARQLEHHGIPQSLLIVGGQVLTMLIFYGLVRWVASQVPDRHTMELRAHLRKISVVD